MATDIEALIAETRNRPTGYYPRLCLISLRQQGFTDLVEVTGAHADEEARYRAWTVESLYTGLVSMERGDKVMALRCLIQAANYNGRLGGVWWHNLGDAFSHLKNELETVLQGGAS